MYVRACDVLNGDHPSQFAISEKADRPVASSYSTSLNVVHLTAVCMTNDVGSLYVAIKITKFLLNYVIYQQKNQIQLSGLYFG